MKALFNKVNRFLRSPAGLVSAGFAGLLALAGIVTGQTTTIPEVTLSSEPLYARGFRAKPTLTLALSVEYPTVGAAYVNGADTGNDPTYTASAEYIGYFDPNGCYLYSETTKYFSRAAAASAHKCEAEIYFSGNFMNWATTSAIDILRYGLTGGDRITDVENQTVLQRAVLRSAFYNSTNFPSKRLSASMVKYSVPKDLYGKHTGDIYIANCLNKIFFGTERAGDCNAPGNNGNLGREALILPADKVIDGALPTADFNSTACSAERSSCTLSDARYVAYGAGKKYNVKALPAGSFACANEVFSDPAVGVAKACYVSKAPIAPVTAPPAEGFFYARVQVCDSADSASRPALCTLQASGYHKPIGNLQRYSDRLRVAVFGYLKDDSVGRYGGVLRAPMKYVGPKQFNENFTLLAGTNPRSEWDEKTGVFKENPEGAAEKISGAVNYLNKFGRTGQVAGEYKSKDPVSELHYEALRYLQGLPPTPAAVSNISEGQADGFPVYTTWSDPHPMVVDLPINGSDTYACVKNNILTIGDVNTHADKSLPGNALTTSGDTVRAANPAANEPDFYEWTRVVGAFESNGSRAYLDGKGKSRATNNPSTVNTDNKDLQDLLPNAVGGGGCCDDNRYYMVGAAYWANTHDIRPSGLTGYDAAKARPGMRATTYMIDVNEYGEQTFEKKFKHNQFYLAAKYGGFNDRSQVGNPFLDKDGKLDDTNWARPVPKTAAEANGTMFAADGLVAKTYFQGNNARELLAALDDVFVTVIREAGSIAGAALSSARLSAESAIFQGSFDPSDWSGDLIRFRVSKDSSGRARLSTADDLEVTQSAARALDKLTDVGARKIFVGKSTPNLLGAATEFTWEALDEEHKIALKTPPAPTPQDNDDMGRLRVNYLRGDRSQESTGNLRRRGSRLGDIVNSGVVFSGKPISVIGDAAYDKFFKEHQTRVSAVFVGANDGMLHAFHADTMAELFAYIPSFVVKNLRDFTLPAYAHRSYVDATPTVAEAKVGGAWKTVLVSGVGGGGQGVFALDVSSPTTFTADQVMWEFTDRNDASMGNVIGRPQILRLRTSASSGPTAEYKHFAVFASGVNSHVVDGSANNSGKPTIFILDLAKGSGEWSLGSNYWKIELPAGDTRKANGLVGFSVVPGPVGEVESLYAGDLQGRLWKLDFLGVGKANWTAEGLSAFKSGTTPEPLFVATDAVSGVQPITVEPQVAYGPNRGYIVTFGTGKLLETVDLTTPYQTQSYYAVYDDRQHKVPNRRYLKQNSASADKMSAEAFTWGVPANESATGVRAGWYFDFPGTAAGERQISGISLIGGYAVFGTVEPATNGCADGSGRVYFVELGSGGGRYTASTVGIQGQPLIMKVGEDKVSDSTSDGRSVRETHYEVIFQGSEGLKLSDSSDGGGTFKKQTQTRSWRQIFNYDSIK